MAVSELLRYGAWSGPGWTAGLPADVFAPRGLTRKLAARDLAVPGIDRYDNFVAKAHDINEYVAQDRLREVLGKLGLIDNSVVATGDGFEAYRQDLVYGDGRTASSRFVSQAHYLDALVRAKGSAEQVRALCLAFRTYFHHVMRSNLQFAVDCVLNDVDRLRNATRGAFKMGVQLLVAPHWFLGEAHQLELYARQAVERLAPPPPPEAPASDPGAAFVSPGDAMFKPVDGAAHVPVLTRGALLATPREELVALVPNLMAARNRFGRRALQAKFARAAPSGFAVTEKAHRFLADL